MRRIDLEECVDSTPLNQEETQELVSLVETLNEKMRSSGASGSELAFGLGCGIGLIPVFGVTLLLLILRLVSLVPAMLILVVGLVGLASISALLASLARTNAHKRVYREIANPEIDRFLNQHPISRQVFDNLAYQSLPNDAPLRDFLSPALNDGGEISPGVE